jgi:hypothetical protein
MLVHVMNQRDEAWHEENVLRARQVELEHSWRMSRNTMTIFMKKCTA